MKTIKCLIANELRILRKEWTLYLLFFGVISLLYLAFESKAFQVIMFFKKTQNISYYNIIALPVLTIVLPFVCLFLIYDSVSGDIKEQRIRLIVSSVRRREYLLSKYISRFILIFIGVTLISLFLLLYSFYSFKVFDWNLFVVPTLTIYLTILLSVMFLLSMFLFISTFFKNPLFVSLFALLIFFVFTFFEKTSFLSFYTYMNSGKLSLSLVAYFVIATLIFISANILLFSRKNL